MKFFILMTMLSLPLVSMANDKGGVGEKSQECADTPGTACHALKMAKLAQEERQAGKQVESGAQPSQDSSKAAAKER